MRVKLFYTAEEEDVLVEAAKILGLSSTDLQHSVDLFNQIQQELKGEKEEGEVVNINKAVEMLEEFRTTLLNIDTRVAEVGAIVTGYDAYVRSLREQNANSPSVSTTESVSDGAVHEL